MSIPDSSDEQLKVIISLEEDNNVVVDSIPGSGKTTTIILACERFKRDKKIAVLTYNRKLKDETRAKMDSLGLNNVEVQTYHSFAVKYVDPSCRDDRNLIRVLRKNKRVTRSYSFDLIILDETQDMSPLYYKLIRKVFEENTVENAQVCVLGDERQCIYNFIDSDSRFLTCAKAFFSFNDKSWKYLYLTRSFRMTLEIADFINKVVLKTKSTKIRSDKKGSKPFYLICNSYGNKVFNKIRTYLVEKKYNPGDIFILAPSINTKTETRGLTPVNTLANKITENFGETYPCHVRLNDNDNDEHRNKIISTFHRSKGLERPLVIVFSFDYGFHRFYKKVFPREEIENSLYVAITRASKELILVHDSKNDFLPFLDKRELLRTCDIDIDEADFRSAIRLRELHTLKDIPEAERIEGIEGIESREVNVLKAIRFLPNFLTEELYEILNIERNESYHEKLSYVTNIVEYDDTTENVEDINITALMANTDSILTRRESFISKAVKELITNYEKRENFFLKELLKENKKDIDNILSKEVLSISDLLFLSNVFYFSRHGYLFKLKQVKDYDWLTEENLNELTKRLLDLGLDSDSFSITLLKYRDPVVTSSLLLKGEVFCLNQKENKVYVFKFLEKDLKHEHFFELALISYLCEVNNLVDSEKVERVLFNIITNEYYTINCSFSDLELFVSKITWHYKNNGLVSLKSTEEFISEQKNG